MNQDCNHMDASVEVSNVRFDQASSQSLHSLMDELFGGSSDDADSDVHVARNLEGAKGTSSHGDIPRPQLPGFSPSPSCHKQTLMPGLHQVKGFLPDEDQQKLRSLLESEPWYLQGANQSMRFGDLPAWALQLSTWVHQLAANKALLPHQIESRQPLFNQMIVNLYRPGEGITSHVDLLRFQDGIASISLGDPVVMKFTPTQSEGSAPATCGTTGCLDSLPQHDVAFESQSCESGHTQQAAPGISSEVQVLLEAGDLLLMHGPARYEWAHGIDAVAEEWFNGEQHVVRGTRLSITLRRLCEDIVLCDQ